MKVRDWQDILQEVADKNVEPAGWRAVGGDRSSGVGEELFLAHPAVGVYQLKTYAKNPFEVQGVGTRVARRIDEDLDEVGTVVSVFGPVERPYLAVLADRDDAALLVGSPLYARD